MSKSAPFHACTTATRAQLPAVRVLCASVLAEHPDAEITVLLVDGDEPSDDAPEFRLITPDAVGLPTGVFPELAMACTASELTDALTPWLVRLLVERGAPAVLAFGPDTCPREPSSPQQIT